MPVVAYDQVMVGGVTVPVSVTVHPESVELPTALKTARPPIPEVPAVNVPREIAAAPDEPDRGIVMLIAVSVLHCVGSPALF